MSEHTPKPPDASMPPPTARRPVLHDPLVDAPLSPGARFIRDVGLAVSGGALHLILGALLVSTAPKCSPEPLPPEPQDEAISVSVIEEPPPKEEPPPEPPPKEEPPPEPPPKEEPPPEPPPEPPKPAPKPKVKPKPTPAPKDPPPPDTKPEPPPKPDAKPAGAMDPVELEGLTADSLSDKGAFTIKAGTGIKDGNITNQYVDPKRFDKIITRKGAKGDGTGTGMEAGTAKTVPTRSCPDKDEKLIKQVKAPYPPEARRRQIEARIVALLTVGTDGKVTRVKLIKKAGSPFDEAAEAAFKKWLFKPAEKNCAPIAKTIRYTYAFDLEDY